MGLKTEIDTLDGVDQKHHDLYIKGDDGKYRLDVEGMPDITGLKSALGKERDTVRDLRNRMKALEGVDPEEVARLREQIAEFEKAGKVDVEKVVGQRVEKYKQDTETRLGALQKERDSFLSELSVVKIDSTVAQLASQKGVVETAMPDLLRRAREVFKLVEGRLTPVDAKGEVIYGPDAVTPLTIDGWLTGLTKDAPHLFKPSTGGGASNKGNGGGQTVRSRADLKTPAAKAAYIREHGQDAYLDLPEK